MRQHIGLALSLLALSIDAVFVQLSQPACPGEYGMWDFDKHHCVCKARFEKHCSKYEIANVGACDCDDCYTAQCRAMKVPDYVWH